MPVPIITLTTDYGLNDHLVGAMKGAIVNINPEARIYDITHGVVPFDLLDGALAVAQAYRYYPSRTIHVVVVDPGVGTARRPLLVAGDQHYFVAPDNGVLSLVFDREETIIARHITEDHFFLQPLSNTFHGRDVFAPAAAWLSRNWQPESFGEEITDYARFSLPKPKAENNSIKGIVLRVDTFGNLITNLTPQDAPQLLAAEAKFTLRVGSAEVRKAVQTFAQGEPGEPVAFVGASGFFEIGVNKGSAAKTVGAQRGAEFTLQLG